MKALTGYYDGLPGKVPTKIEPAGFLYFDSDGWRRMRLARKKIQRDDDSDERETRQFADVRCAVTLL
jgi:adenylate kinase